MTEARVLIVSGKGGTGKTTVAAALAFAAVARGRSVLLLELEGRPGAGRLLGLEGASAEERATPFGFSVASIGPREALLEYLGLFYGMRRIAGPLLRARAVETVTEVAPGFRDLMLAGKIYETSEWRRRSPRARGRPHYDLVMADAPPTGQIVPFLSAPSAFGDMIRIGRAAGQAHTIDAFLRKRARVVLVTTPEDLAVSETLEAHAAIAELGVPLGPVVVNRVLPPVGAPRQAIERLDAETVAARAARAGLDLGPKRAAAVAEVTRRHADAEREQHEQAARLAAIPTVELPQLFAPAFGPDELRTLAARLDAIR